MSKQEVDSFVYEGGDLEAMMVADNYYRWILDIIRPYIGKRVVEVGGGVGTFSKLILETSPESISVVEPSKNTYKQLKENLKSTKKTKVDTYNNYLSGVKSQLKKAKPDTAIYINVFEHIEDDAAELKHIKDILQPEGRAIIFVPALPALYSDFDKSIDHFRRYTKADLRKLCEDNGMKVVHMQYMDMIGIAPWWFSFVLMKRTSLVPFLIKTYDKLCVPIIRATETVIRVPVGKNLLIIAEKKAD